MTTFPPLPNTNYCLDLPGFAIGHGSDLWGKTGVTVILCPQGAVACAELRGSATGTRQFDSLISPNHVASRAHAVVLAGGSGFGLDAATPVVDHLAQRGIGFRTGVRPVPLVPTAILFDLAFGSAEAVPTAALVSEAIRTAEGMSTSSQLQRGSVGAGTGATVGKVLGPERAMKGGFGFASLTTPTGVTVAAAVAVNAFGDVRDPGTNQLIAGCRLDPSSLELVDAGRVLAALQPGKEDPWEGNTTLAAVLTDAALTKTELSKVCQMAFGGFYRALKPALSLFDGDLVVALSSAKKEASVNQVGFLAEQAVAEAIVDGVRSADGFGILPAARDLQPLGKPRNLETEKQRP
ncbi:MAG: P1 family peptidase [Deltaproteobacteria bacterium]|nr:P1 family peptidase [Deltaproteobacteria bacterium]